MRTPVTASVRRILHAGPRGVLKRSRVTGWVRRIPEPAPTRAHRAHIGASAASLRSAQRSRRLRQRPRPLPRHRLRARCASTMHPSPGGSGRTPAFGGSGHHLPDAPRAGPAAEPDGGSAAVAAHPARRRRLAPGPGHSPNSPRRGVPMRTPVTASVRRILHAGPSGVPKRSRVTGLVRRIPEPAPARRPLPSQRTTTGAKSTSALPRHRLGALSAQDACVNAPYRFRGSASEPAAPRPCARRVADDS